MGNQGEAERPLVKLIIVDDEPVICRGLRLTIDWSELGVEVIGEAYDGEEALRLMEREQADIVLTDIRMDGMDGLELASQLNQRYPDVRIIIISGYEDFHYARQAMRIGVHDYLLKPVEIDELVKAVSRMVEEMRVRSRQDGSQEIKLWLTNVARNGIAYSKEAPPSLQGSQYRIVASQLDRYQERYGELTPEQLDELREQWLDRIRQAAGLRPELRSFSIFDHENLLITLIVADGKLQAAEWETIWNQAARACMQPPALYLGVSQLYEDLNETALRCAEAANLLNYHVLEQATVLDSHTELLWSERRQPAALDLAQSVQLLSSALFKQSQNDMQAAVASLFVFFKEQLYFLHEIESSYEELLALLRQRLRKSGITGLDSGISGSAIDLNLFNTYESLEQAVHRNMQKLFELIEQIGGDRSYWIVEKSKRYIEEHYTEELKASEVAAWLKITPSYFSYIFKQSTGKGFTEFLNELRMERAKCLLATTHDKVFEIAAQVGYKEYKYFVTVFKSYMGMTPKKYRSLQAGNTEPG
ncbi:response regulator [Paenibacillus sp. LHD-117]|uniref:response regulator transcription factor n=1 Tax=Paenibacillus sp. LHD-117 TaxID=3071412 RepID=UPI0027DF7468|nr:response regulator [Paenibacillus sp. LHD-117]MDQ6417834.1 response regulator [Paenibacillus sp. LHD-117]